MYVFIFKQKTAYEMRISDWSSDVCSSDLKKHRQVCGEFRHLQVLHLSGMNKSVEQRQGGGRVFAFFGKVLEFVDRVYLGSHGNIGHTLQNKLNDDGNARSEERRERKEGVRTGRSSSSQYHKKKKKK